MAHNILKKLKISENPSGLKDYALIGGVGIAAGILLSMFFKKFANVKAMPAYIPNDNLVKWIASKNPPLSRNDMYLYHTMGMVKPSSPPALNFDRLHLTGSFTKYEPGIPTFF